MNDPCTPDHARDLSDLGHLASAIGHHVINTFSAVVSNAEVLRQLAEESGSHTQATIAETIIRSAIEASGVARRLIDYVRPTTAPGESPVRLDQLAEQVVAAAQTESSSLIRWTVETSPVPAIRGDDQRLRQMIGHLLTNAREALTANGGTITVSTSRDDRGWVVLEVRDNGRGMTPREHEHAVEPFFTTKVGHLGIGLSIANGIWRRHKGTMSIQSQSGVGTRVRLCIEPEHDEHDV